MAITEAALMGIACILTHAPTQKSVDMYQQLPQEAQVQVYTAVKSGACLPQKVEMILQKPIDVGTAEEIQKKKELMRGSPSHLTGM